jgi:hypothetical protein
MKNKTRFLLLTFTFLLCILCALVSLWLKLNLSAVACSSAIASATAEAKADQSKIINYAKRTQFFKKSNIYNLNKNNQLQRKIQLGHLVKTNPIKPKFTRRSEPVRHSPLATAEAKAGKANFNLCWLRRLPARRTNSVRISPGPAVPCSMESAFLLLRRAYHKTGQNPSATKSVYSANRTSSKAVV